MAEQEQGAERWEEWTRWSSGGFHRYKVAERDGVPDWIVGGEFLTVEHLNALEADLAALRQQLADAEAKAALADELRAQLNWLASCAVPGSPLLTLLERYDALTSPSRDTSSEEGKG